ncbi:GNAT family N-acetyltransferase [Kineococcus sp. LSe6-4]|uniref:GNAT family N-acetyltransferase n=1 Tax=Kineococcus halophytocola TaxID=3234027 RepID=A0ABV4GZ95_9ACTN
MADLAVSASGASGAPGTATATSTGTSTAASDPGLHLVHDPAHGLSVTVRRHLDHAPVPEWRALAHRAGQPPFTGPDWLRAVHSHLGRGEPLLVSVRRDGRLLAFGAFALLGGPRPLLTFLGAGGSDYAGVLTDPDADVPAVRLVAAVLDGALREAPGALWDLEQVPDGEQAEVLVAWARFRGYGVRTLPQAVVHTVALAATVDEHDAGLGRHARHEERRQWRRLAELGELTVADDLLEAVTAARGHDPEAAADRLEELVTELAEVDDAHPHADRRRRPWRGASGRTLTEVLWTSPPGTVQLSGVRVDGELVAYAFCLAGPRALHGYVQSYRARYAPTGPGTLLLLRLCRRAVLSGYRELDLLRGDEVYKRRLRPTPRRTVRLVLTPPGRDVVPALADRLALLRRTYRDEVRRSERLDRSWTALVGAVGRVREEAARRRGALPAPPRIRRRR